MESYVLGLASEEERREFEQLCALYPELLDARIAFELSLEKEAIENAVTPPIALKEKIMTLTHNNAKTATLPASPVRYLHGWKYAAAACLLVLAGSIYLNVSLSDRNKKLQTNFDNTVAELDAIKKDIAMLTSQPQVKMASLKGTEISPHSYTTVYWDTASHDVYLLANNLPSPPTDKQYQLWALLDGKPIDLGMLDYDLKQKKLLIRMKNAQEAEAFAITLEEKDRPDTSTPAGEMFVMGKL